MFCSKRAYKIIIEETFVSTFVNSSQLINTKTVKSKLSSPQQGDD